jgi:hypothetical protein
MATQNKLLRLEVTVGQSSEIVEFTEEETLEHEALVAELQIRDAQIEAERVSKIQARQSALAKLAELGLTEEEIAAL